MPPPGNYYLDNLQHLIGWVERHHARLIDAQLRGFLLRFRQLPLAARRLLVRMLMRRGPQFRRDTLDYPEVDDAGRALLALALAGCVSLQQTPAARLQLARVPELRKLLVAAGAPPSGRLRRPELLRCARAAVHRCDSDLQPLAACLPAVIRLEVGDAIDCLRLLFFGNLQQDLVEFILADLGTLRFAQVVLDPVQPWPDSASLRRSLALHRVADRVRDLAGNSGDAGGAGDAGGVRRQELESLARALRAVPDDAGTRARRDRALLRLARIEADAGRIGRRLRLLRALRSPPARELICRALADAGRARSAARLLAQIGRAPRDASELRFADRFDVQRRRCRAQRRRDTSLRIERLCLPAPAQNDFETGIEGRVSAMLTARGNRALHLENHLPGMLFVLGCWDILFAPVPGAFVQPFQSGPVDLLAPEFPGRRRAAIEQRLAAIRSAAFDTAQFLDVLATHRGIRNPFWPWPEHEIGPDSATLRAIITSLPPELRAAICGRVAEQPLRARRGFPDLTIANGSRGCCSFVEVKGPGDQLRPEQREWLGFLASVGADARVLEVRWA